MMNWQPIKTAPTDGTPFLAWVDDPAEVDGWWEKPPAPAGNIVVAWNGHPNPDQPREAHWVCTFVNVETYSGSEWTGSWNEYEWERVAPTHWMPLPAAPK